ARRRQTLFEPPKERRERARGRDLLHEPGVFAGRPGCGPRDERTEDLAHRAPELRRVPPRVGRLLAGERELRPGRPRHGVSASSSAAAGPWRAFDAMVFNPRRKTANPASAKMPPKMSGTNAFFCVLFTKKIDATA